MVCGTELPCPGGIESQAEVTPPFGKPRTSPENTPQKSKSQKTQTSICRGKANNYKTEVLKNLLVHQDSHCSK